MRDRAEIEREMFRARQDLERSVALLVHHVREQLAVRARAGHAMHTRIRAHARWIVLGLITCGLAIWASHRRRAASDSRSR